MSVSHHRRTYLVDRGFQLKYIVLLAGWGLVLTALFGLWAHQAQQQVLETVATSAPQQAQVARGNRELLWVLAAISGLSAIALGLLGFIMTHRVAGPIYVMGHYLTLLAEGRYPPRRALRRDDELRAFHAHFVATLERMKERDASEADRLENAVRDMRAALARAPELARAIEGLEAEARRLRSALAESAFSATPPPLARAR
jgi:hypothetical protein